MKELFENDLVMTWGIVSFALFIAWGFGIVFLICDAAERGLCYPSPRLIFGSLLLIPLWPLVIVAYLILALVKNDWDVL